MLAGHGRIRQPKVRRIKRIECLDAEHQVCHATAQAVILLKSEIYLSEAAAARRRSIAEVWLAAFREAYFRCEI